LFKLKRENSKKTKLKELNLAKKQKRNKCNERKTVFFLLFFLFLFHFLFEQIKIFLVCNGKTIQSRQSFFGG
jgi:hypothetical protein